MDPEAADAVVAWQERVVEQLRLMIRDWEQLLDEGDTTLYSLGLRHAIDVVEGRGVRNLEEPVVREDADE